MILGDLLDLMGHKKRKKERVEKAQKFAIGMGILATAGAALVIVCASKSGKRTRECIKRKAVDTVETVKDTAQNITETVKNSTSHAKQEASQAIKDVHGKTEAVRTDIADGFHEIAQDVQKTAKAVSNDLDKSTR